MIIQIGGYAEHGKDTLADMLKEELEPKYDSIRYAYADSLKMIAETIFNWDGTKTEENRTMLQQLGKFAREFVDIDFWVKDVQEQVDMFDADFSIISDMRFLNESTFWKKRDYDCLNIRVIRLNNNGTIYENSLTEEQKNDSSEKEIDLIENDYVIEAKNLDELREGAMTLIEEIENMQ
jgi:hypothetical protein